MTKLVKISIASICFFLSYSAVLAQAATPTPVKRIFSLFGKIEYSNPQQAIQVFVSSATNTLTGFSISLAILMIITSGIQRITAGADEKALKAATERTQHAIIGLILVVTAVLIQKYIFSMMY